MDPFAAYAKQALSPKRDVLLGPIARRADARIRYSEIVAELNGASSREDLEIYLLNVEREITQFKAELQFFWDGDDDFLGLEKEIERARARLDDGLDYPRWMSSYLEKDQGQ